MEALVEVRGLVNRFGAQIVHDGLDMTVERGEVFGIVGGSGSGKSVLLRSILGLQRPQAGEVRLMGRDTQPAWAMTSCGSVKAHYGVTFQQGALFTSLDGAAERAAAHDRAPAALAARARRAGPAQGAAGGSARRGGAASIPSQLSGGMIKRAALARALALDPALLMLDEPTAGLDPISAAAFDELLMDLRQQLGLTVIMITHDLDTIFRTCNRVGVIIDRKMTSDTLEGITRQPASVDPGLFPWRARRCASARQAEDQGSHGA